MSWEMGIAVSSVGIVFYFAWMGWQFIDRSSENAMHQGVGLGLLAVSMVFVWLTTNLMVELVSNAAPANVGIEDDLISQYVVSLVVGILVMVYFGLLVMFGPMKGAIEKRRFRY